MPTTTHHTPGPLDLDIRVQAGRVEIETAETDETTVELEPLDGGDAARAAVESARHELRPSGDGHRLVIEIARRPRLFGVQAAHCAPYEAAFRAGVETLGPIEVRPTIAEGIATPRPTRGPEVLRAVRESGGSVVAVEEAEIVAALRELARRGLYVEPTAATAAAGLTRLLASGVIRPQEDTVLVLTGSGLKASAAIGELLKLGPRSGD